MKSCLWHLSLSKVLPEEKVLLACLEEPLCFATLFYL